MPFSSIKPFLLNLLGHKVSKNAKIGLSIIVAQKLVLGNSASIGHLNFISISKICLKSNARIRNVNYLKGNFDLLMKSFSIIINFNLITRGSVDWAPPCSKLVLGKNSQITSFSSIDLAASVILGNDVVLAGKGIQVWTHGFVHDYNRNRYLVTGKVILGNNIYIGARTCINPGVRIADDVTVGVNATISKNLNRPGLYVSHALRHLEFNPHQRLESFQRVINNESTYYQK